MMRGDLWCLETLLEPLSKLGKERVHQCTTWRLFIGIPIQTDTGDGRASYKQHKSLRDDAIVTSWLRDICARMSPFSLAPAPKVC